MKYLLCMVFGKIIKYFLCDYTRHMHTQPSLNEVPAPAVAPTLSQTPPPSNEARERKRPALADGDENPDPEDKPPKAKQLRTIKVELPPSDTSQDTTGMMCVRFVVCDYIRAFNIELHIEMLPV